MATKKFRMSASFTPIVILPADADSDSAEVIHHDVKKTLGSHVEVDDDDLAGTQRWFYESDYTIQDGNTSFLIGTYTDGTSVHVNDKVQALYIHHKGVDETGAATSSKIYLVADGGSNPVTETDSLVLRPNCSLVLSYEEATTLQFIARSNSGLIKAEICALITDV